MGNSSGVVGLVSRGNPLIFPRRQVQERLSIDALTSRFPEGPFLASKAPVTVEPIEPGEDDSVGP
jgi:hypothetical protein